MKENITGLLLKLHAESRCDWRCHIPCTDAAARAMMIAPGMTLYQNCDTDAFITATIFLGEAVKQDRDRPGIFQPLMGGRKRGWG